MVYQIEGPIGVAHTSLGHVCLYLIAIKLISDLQHLAGNYSIGAHDTNFLRF